MCPVWRRCFRTCVTIFLAFILAYLLLQCIWLLLGPVLINSSIPPAVTSHLNNRQTQILASLKPHRVPLSYPYSAKEVTLKPFIAPPTIETDKPPQEQQNQQNQPKRQHRRRRQHGKPFKFQRPIAPNENPSQAAQKNTGHTIKKANHKLQTIPLSDLMGRGTWPTRHCRHQSPYYSASFGAEIRGVHVGLKRALDLLKTFSKTSFSVDPLNTSKILPSLCVAEQTQLLFVIQSDLQNITQRNRIRQSWATMDYFNFDAAGLSASGPAKVDYLFLVDFIHNQTLNWHLLDSFTKEVQIEQDVLPILMNPEHKSLYHGYLQAGEFILTRCGLRVNSVAFLKDDLMPNIPLLGSFASEATHQLGKLAQTNPMYCFTVEGERPVRSKKHKQPGKVTVTQAEWAKPVYPTYCDLKLGGFLISVRSLQLWMSCALVYRPFAKLPQVYLTGILTEAAGVPVKRYWTTYGDPVPMLPSLGSGSQAGQHLFFTQTNIQPWWVWKSVFRSILSEALR
ncbi:Hexosyltransferase [Fasciola gigantica]|uniref:Hexosyltransferase n=1 Tax=Fasciola gigantica TaxID=46835 RepID=A0A504YLE3_FASGI|nr:Hexosyltransferase [Fasciola gigantica]